MLRLFKSTPENTNPSSRFEKHPHLQLLVLPLERLRKHLRKWEEEFKHLESDREKLVNIINKKVADLDFEETVTAYCERIDNKEERLFLQLQLLQEKICILKPLANEIDNVIKSYNRPLIEDIDGLSENEQELQLIQELQSLIYNVKHSKQIEILSKPRNQKRQDMNASIDSTALLTGISIAFFTPLSFVAGAVTVGSLMGVTTLGKSLTGLNDLTPESVRIVNNIESILFTIQKNLLAEHKDKKHLIIN